MPLVASFAISRISFIYIFDRRFIFFRRNRATKSLRLVELVIPMKLGKHCKSYIHVKAKRSHKRHLFRGLAFWRCFRSTASTSATCCSFIFCGKISVSHCLPSPRVECFLSVPRILLLLIHFRIIIKTKKT